ncbi:hypothetical protein [Mycoplasma simbae]|uniref:hypothetical protein n=1 Tax=Mycoplasma simbae TaxID=36744 RepID=UPI00049775B8|nr:hypothetical protein [Mycoplasma simbae]
MYLFELTLSHYIFGKLNKNIAQNHQIKLLKITNLLMLASYLLIRIVDIRFAASSFWYSTAFGINYLLIYLYTNIFIYLRVLRAKDNNYEYREKYNSISLYWQIIYNLLIFSWLMANLVFADQFYSIFNPKDLMRTGSLFAPISMVLIIVGCWLIRAIVVGVNLHIYKARIKPAYQALMIIVPFWYI